MLKMALLDCAINEKCCSVDGGRGICPLFSSPPRGIDSSGVPNPGNLPSKAQKMLMPGGQPGGGGGGLGAGGIDRCINQKKILGNICVPEQIFYRKQSLGVPDSCSLSC